MRATQFAQVEGASGLCASCGIPADSKYFDDSGIVPVPEPGREVVLARFELSPQYCGVLEYFSQYTDAFARDSSSVQTPGLQWVILSNRHVLYPYTNLRHIINPWGYGSFPIALRLNEGATIELAVRRISPDDTGIASVGGRIVGRYWYNAAYDGSAVRYGRQP